MREFKINPERLKIYRDYQYERANIYYKKEILKEPKPWTDWEELQTFKFTNVLRELDRESKFLIRTVCNNPNLSMEDKALNCALFRIINNESGTKFLPEWPIGFVNCPEPNWEELKAEEDKFLSSEESKGLTLQSNAYFLSLVVKLCYSNSEFLRGYQLARLKYIWDNKELILDALKQETAKDAVSYLQKVKGFGDFIAYQIWADWTYCSEYPFTDDDTISCGPGTTAGTDWLLGNVEVFHDNGGKARFRDNTANWSQQDYREWNIWFRNNLPEIMKENGIEWDVDKLLHFMPEEKRVWSLQAVTNSFCEFNKLMRLTNGIEMRVRNYDGQSKSS